MSGTPSSIYGTQRCAPRAISGEIARRALSIYEVNLGRSIVPTPINSNSLAIASYERHDQRLSAVLAACCCCASGPSSAAICHLSVRRVRCVGLRLALNARTTNIEHCAMLRLTPGCGERAWLRRAARHAKPRAMPCRPRTKTPSRPHRPRRRRRAASRRRPRWPRGVAPC